MKNTNYISWSGERGNFCHNLSAGLSLFDLISISVVCFSLCLLCYFKLLKIIFLSKKQTGRFRTPTVYFFWNYYHHNEWPERMYVVCVTGNSRENLFNFRSSFLWHDKSAAQSLYVPCSHHSVKVNVRLSF